MSLCDNVTVREINRDVAKDIIENYHYAGILGPVSYTLGIYYKGEHDFFDSHEELVGAIAYARPLGRLSVKSISEHLKAEQSLELTRLFIHDGYPKNIESYSIARSFDWIKTNHPKVEVLLSYSDPEQGHLGIIYQATNWLYQGTGFSIMDKYRLSLTKEPYDWIHHRTIYDLYGTVSIDELKRQIGHTFWLKTETNKHRYIYILKNRKYWLKNLKYPILPYPKQIQREEEEIREITV
jgi:hypothetical protein